MKNYPIIIIVGLLVIICEFNLNEFNTQEVLDEKGNHGNFPNGFYLELRSGR